MIKAAVFADDDDQMFDWRCSLWRICPSVTATAVHRHGACHDEQGGRYDHGAATPAGTAIPRMRQQRSSLSLDSDIRQIPGDFEPRIASSTGLGQR